MRRISRRGPGGVAVLFVSILPLLGAAGGCVSGRVLTGYPGYPFARFDTRLPADSTFFLLQPAVESEGFALDYTILDEGFITTRSSEMLGRPVFLNLVVEPLEQDDYVARVVDFLERLPAPVVVQRLSGRGRPEVHLAPDWAPDYRSTQRKVIGEFRRRGSRQGAALSR